jgi:hypothetical protein
MSRRQIAVSLAGIVVVLLGAAGWFVLRAPDAPASPSTEISQSPDSARSSGSQGEVASARSEGASGSSTTSHNDFNARYLQSKDLLAFAEGLLDAAKAGDGASRYWLYRALNECSSGFGGSQTLEEALLYAAQDAVDAEVIRDWFARCEVLRGPKGKDFGDPKLWLKGSAESGYPLAQVQQALELESQSRRDEENAQTWRAESRALALEALSSKDPAAIASIGRLAAVAQDRQQKFDLADAWLLAACLRGFDCGEHSEYFPVWCRGDPACQPFETVIDLMRRRYGADFSAVENSARVINDRIDAGRFDDLGF